MRPTSLELLRGVRAMLAREILPETASPTQRLQVTMAIGMLDAAAAELNHAPMAFHEERTRMTALAAWALPVLESARAEPSLVADLAAVAGAPSEPLDRRISAMAEDAARLLDLLDRISAFCDERLASGETSPDVTLLGERVDTELRAQIARRSQWVTGQPAMARGQSAIGNGQS